MMVVGGGVGLSHQALGPLASIGPLTERASIGDSIGASTERASIRALTEWASIGGSIGGLDRAGLNRGLDRAGLDRGLHRGLNRAGLNRGLDRAGLNRALDRAGLWPQRAPNPCAVPARTRPVTYPPYRGLIALHRTVAHLPRYSSE